MFKVSLINKSFIFAEGYFESLQDADLWIKNNEKINAWGFSERSEFDEEGNPTGVILPAEYTIEIEDITAEHELAQCLAARRAEYPSPEEFMNALFDGGDTAIEELKQKRLAIKAKYPKP